MWERTAPGPFSSSGRNGWARFLAGRARRSNGWMTPRSRRGFACCVPTTRPGAFPVIPASSVLPGPSRKPHCCLRMVDGVFLRAQPTTHIFKPPTGDLDGHVENEHFCLELARALGLPVENSCIMHFQDEIAIVIERYDRLRIGSAWRRVHQEDTCQALGIPPFRKYQSDGGPGIRDIVEILETYSTSPREDIDAFLDSIALNWLIAGTDAHGKNYSLLIGAEGRIRLAPLYDVASVLPYPEIDVEKIRLSMKLGGQYRMRSIGVREWRKLAVELRRDPEELIRRVEDFAQQLGDHVSAVKSRMVAEGVAHPLIARLAN